MKLSHRIFLLILVTISLSTLANFLLTQYQQKALHNDSEKILAYTIVQSLRDALVQDVIDGNKLRVTNLLRSLKEHDNPIEFLYVTDTVHGVFAHSFEQGFPRYLVHTIDHPKGQSGNYLAHKYQTERGLIYGYREVLIPGLDIVLHIGINQSEIAEKLANNKHTILVTSAIITLLALLFAYLRSRQITAPLAEFAHKIQRFGAGDTVDFAGFGKADPDIRYLAMAFQSATDERHRAHTKLQEREQNLTITLNSIGDAVITTDAEGHVTRMNPVAEQLTGWSFDEAQGQPLKNIFPIIDASTRESMENPIEKVMATGKTIYLSNHTTLISKDGTEYQIADSAAPIRDDEHILGIVLVFNDVTEQYQLRQTAAKSKRDLQAVMDNSPAIIYVKDANGCFTFINRRFEELFHLQREEIIGKTLYDIFPKDIADKMRDNDKAVLATGHALKLEEVAPHDDGLHSYISVKFPLFDDNGNAYAVCGISTDITERQQTEKALRRSQKMEAIGQLSGGIAHDFNNQLGVIIGYLDFLQGYVGNDEKPRQWVDTATRATLRCMDLTRQLLTFSRRQTKEKTVVNLNSLLQDLKTLIARSVTPEVEVQYFPTDELWLTEIDPGEFQDVILNLVINARDAMPSGGTLLIETSNKHLDAGYAALNPEVETAGDYVQLMLSDTGMGMDKKTLEHVFEPFFTTKPEGKGTGLGLAMVYGFVKRYGGNIKVYSEPGIGTTMRLYLPRSTVSESAATVNNREELKLPTGNETILIVDDEVDLLELADQYLSDLGYHTRTAENVAQALEILAKDEEVDLLFSDVVMPGGMNGYELAQQATEYRPGLKVLLTSGFTSKAMGHNGLARFCVHLLNKPYRKVDLAQRVRLVLDEKLERVRNLPNADGAKDNLVGRTILVIDDEESVRKLFQLNLEKLGCKSVLACDGDEAIALYQQSLERGEAIDVVILDLTLPGSMGGKEVAGKIRELDPHAKIIVASGDTEGPEMTHYQDYGFQGVLEKNFNRKEIKQVLEQVLLPPTKRRY